ncbi:MAG TPA: hypothetical protein ENN03_02725, partial [bacterium]|nr:hypothetical protein [bacterium]
MDYEFHSRHRLMLPLLFSMAVHGVLIFIFARDMGWNLSGMDIPNPSPLRFEIIETPVLPEEDPPANTRLASDRALRARDTNPENRGSLPMTPENSPVMNWPGPSSSRDAREQAP